jgi:hypothetical protein
MWQVRMYTKLTQKAIPFRKSSKADLFVLKKRLIEENDVHEANSDFASKEKLEN